MINVLYVVGCLTAYFVSHFLLRGSVTWVSQILFFFLPGLLGIRLFKVPLKIKIPPVYECLIIIVSSVIIALLTTVLSSYWNQLFPHPNPYETLKGNVHFLLMIQVCLIPALSEETLFRGFLQNSLFKPLGPMGSILFTSTLFALAHLQLWLFPFYFLLGIYLGCLQNYKNNLAYPIIGHAVINIVGLVLLEL